MSLEYITLLGPNTLVLKGFDEENFSTFERPSGEEMLSSLPSMKERQARCRCENMKSEGNTKLRLVVIFLNQSTFKATRNFNILATYQNILVFLQALTLK